MYYFLPVRQVVTGRTTLMEVLSNLPSGEIKHSIQRAGGKAGVAVEAVAAAAGMGDVRRLAGKAVRILAEENQQNQSPNDRHTGDGEQARELLL